MRSSELTLFVAVQYRRVSWIFSVVPISFSFILIIVLSLLTRFCLLSVSYAAFRQSAFVRQVHTSDAIQVPDCAAAQRRTAWLWTDQGLHLVAFASIQEARLQKLPKHLSAVVYSSLVKHTVSFLREKRFREILSNRRSIFFSGQLYPKTFWRLRLKTTALPSRISSFSRKRCRLLSLPSALFFSFLIDILCVFQKRP